MNDILWTSRVLGAMKEHACLTEEELIVLEDWARGRCRANTAMMHHMSEGKVDKIRKRIREKYDAIQQYAGLQRR